MKNKEVYRKIRKTNTWGNLISLLIFFSVSMGLIALTLAAFLNYSVESKMMAQYHAFENFAGMSAEIVENTEERAAFFDRLDDCGYDYVILDENGKTVHRFGTDTRSSEAIDAKYGFLSQSLIVYEDQDQTYMSVNDAGYIAMDFSKIYQWFRTADERLEALGNEDSSLMITGLSAVDYDDYEDLIEEAENGEGPVITGQNGIFTYSVQGDFDEEFRKATSELNAPIWMAVPIGETGYSFAGKSYFTVDLNEMTLFLEVAGLFILIVMLMIFILLGFSISGIRRQRRVVNYFFTDPVTVGHNQMFFQIKGEQLIRRGRNKNVSFAVITLVFVNYRNYCVCHSVAKGDEVLKQIYEILQKNTKSREIVAHMSFSSFGLILRYDNQENLRARLEGLIKQLEALGNGSKFAFQAGVSPVEPKRNDSGKVQRRRRFDLTSEYNNAVTARSVMSDSEDSGIAFFDDKIVEERRWQDAVTEHQRSAVLNEEFKVYYQPKCNPETHALSGAEALIRWQSPDLGFVTPFRFIPIFEKNGFITEIDHYMITHVARDQRRWLDQGLTCVPVSVNVSRAHFIESDLAEQIRDLVDAENCPHNLIEIELTESAFFDDKKAMIDTITRLKQYGFTVSMDDFGAGYSSLNSLKDMPLDVLKLDAEFFRGNDAGDRGQIVVSEAIKLARSLNMRTVAEGVEIKEQVDFLAAEGCDMIQGYYFAKPMEPEKYEEKMMAGRLDPEE